MTATANVPDTAATEEQRPARRATPGKKPKLAPRWSVVVHNDDIHTFRFVSETFCKILRHSAAESARLTAKIHFGGRAIVWTGSREVAELKCDQLRSAGPDFYVQPPVRVSLRVEIQPMPCE